LLRRGCCSSDVPRQPSASPYHFVFFSSFICIYLLIYEYAFEKVHAEHEGFLFARGARRYAVMELALRRESMQSKNL